MVLSGMSNMDQLRANIATFSEDKPLNDKEMETLLGIAKDMASKGTVPCTACHYCTSHCPQELDIPYIITQYNEGEDEWRSARCHAHRQTSRGQAPLGMYRLPKLRGRMPSADKGIRAHERVCRDPCT